MAFYNSIIYSGPPWEELVLALTDGSRKVVFGVQDCPPMTGGRAVCLIQGILRRGDNDFLLAGQVRIEEEGKEPRWVPFTACYFPNSCREGDTKGACGANLSGRGGVSLYVKKDGTARIRFNTGLRKA